MIRNSMGREMQVERYAFYLHTFKMNAILVLALCSWSEKILKLS